MPNILKKYIFCVILSLTISTSLCFILNFQCSLHILYFILLCCVINVYVVLHIAKRHIDRENEERENKLIKQIEHSSNHLATIMCNLPLVAYITDTECRFITGNSEAIKFFEAEENIEKLRNPETVFDKDTLEMIREENKLIIQTKEPFVTDKIVRLKSGKQNWFNIRKVPIFNDTYEVKGFVIFGRNIDIEKAAQKQRETYISTLSHDLKIPTLAQIRALELLVDGNLGKVNKMQKEVLNLTLDSCRYMYDMLSTLLSTYKYENKDISLTYEKIQVMKLMDECFHKYVKSMHHKNIHIKVKAKEKFFTVYADKSQIKKAFENLIDHCISSAYENTEIVCAIKKTGNGKNVFLSLGFESPYISSENIENLFKRYSTAAEKMGKVGSGLGLYLAKQIINAHNGVIYAESKESNYNIYNIELPCINECKISAIAC